MNTKTCRHCHVTKPVSDFSCQSGGRPHLQPYCKPCVVTRAIASRKARVAATPDIYRARETARKAAFRANNPDKAKASRRRASDRERENAPCYLWHRARARATAKGILFTIVMTDIVVPPVCPVLGIPMSLGGDRENSPTIDRLDGALGYTPENIKVISYRANRIKSDATLNDLRSLVRYMEGDVV